MTLLLGVLVAQPQTADARQKINVQAAHEQMRQIEDARNNSPSGNEPILKVKGHSIGNNPHLESQIRLIERYGEEVFKDYRFDNEQAPYIPKIDFYKMDDPRTLAERIDALVYGITVIIPHDNDVYGYEIRRYMAKIGESETYEDQKTVGEALKNTKRAAIVLEYWGRAVNEEIKAIQKIIDDPAHKVDPSTRSNFKFKSGKARAFIVEANSWINNNHDFFEFLYHDADKYIYKYPAFNFTDRAYVEKFQNLYQAREKSLKIIQGYSPFVMMIY